MKIIIDPMGKVAWVKAISQNINYRKEIEKVIKDLPELDTGNNAKNGISVIINMPVTIRDYKIKPGTFSLDEVSILPSSDNCSAENTKKCITQYINANLRSAQINFENLIKGKFFAIVHFVINKQGLVEQAHIETTNKFLKQALLKVAENMKFNSPAIKDGEPVAISINLPVYGAQY